MKLSLIIATLNRPKELQRCLNSIAQQQYKNFEIIVIDQSDSKEQINNQKICDNYNKLIYKHISHKGLSHARNVGIDIASGEYIVLVDDDGFFNPDSLSIAVKVIEEKKLDLLGAKIVDPVTKKQFCYSHSTYIKIIKAFKYMPSLGMVIRTSFIKQIKFDEDFGVGSKYGAGEETDIVIQAINAGLSVYYSDKYVVNHPVQEDSQLPLERIRLYSYGKGALCKKTELTISRKIGKYYYIKSYYGNYIVGHCEKIVGEKPGEVRIIKAKYIKKGYMEYTKDKEND